MRTFEEIKASVLSNQNALMHRCSDKLKIGGLQDFEERAMKMVIQDCHTYINNIDEVTTIDIGATTNSLIRAIQKAYQLHLTEYWQDFDRFAEEYIIGLTPDGKFKRGSFFGQSQCFKLGVGLRELSCFKGKNPMSNEVGDLFRKLINDNYGTNIPLASVEQQALKDYEAFPIYDTSIEKDRAFVNLKEIQRDAGSLVNGGTYYILATNEKYQEAKARCSGRSI